MILIYVFIYPNCPEDYVDRTSAQLWERVSFYKHDINQSQHQMIKAEEHIGIYPKRKFRIFALFITSVR